MLTPVFLLSQNNRFLIVTIRAPYCKLADTEVSYDGNVFLFHARPYFLRLFLTGELIDDETGTCDYDSEQGQFTICAPKKNPGEHFPRLELLSELLKPQQKIPDASRLVELIAAGPSELVQEKEDNGEEGKRSDEEMNGHNDMLTSDEMLYAKQKFRDEEEPFCCSTSGNGGDSTTSLMQQTSTKFGYGFGWTRHGVLCRFADEIEDLVDLADPENVPIEERVDKLKDFDEHHFREQHYLADLFSPEQLHLDAMEFELNKDQHLKLTEEDMIDLKDLKIRQLEQFGPEITHQIALSLVDILFGFLYDLRTTLGEHNVESGWTISKLAPSLTFLVRWKTLRQAILAAVRHSLVLPLIRNWDLAMAVVRDVGKVLKAGTPAILHCLLTCRRIFNRSGEFRYLFNQLFLDDLCLWIQSVPEEVMSNILAEFREEMKKGWDKSELLELDLEFIETQARMEMLKPLDSDDDEDDEPNPNQNSGMPRYDK